MFYFAFVPHDLLLEEGAGAHVVRAASGLLDPCSTRVVLQQYDVTSKKYREMGRAGVPVFQKSRFFFLSLSVLYFTHSSETKE